MVLEYFAMGAMTSMILFMIAWIVLLIWALVDMLGSKNEPAWKILWLFVLILLPILGVILYFIIGRDQKIGKRTGRRRKKS